MGRGPRIRRVRKGGLRGVQTKIIKIDVTPAPAFLVHQSDENLGAQLFLKIYDRVPHIFAVVAGDFEKYLLVVGADEFDARARQAAAAHEKRGIWQRHLERLGGERPAGRVARDLVTPLPVDECDRPLFRNVNRPGDL